MDSEGPDQTAQPSLSAVRIIGYYTMYKRRARAPRILRLFEGMFSPNEAQFIDNTIRLM